MRLPRELDPDGAPQGGLLQKLTTGTPLVVVIMVAWASVALSAKEVQSLDSPVLRVEVTTDPFSFKVLEKSTGEELLNSSRTSFTSKDQRVKFATDVMKQGDWLTATLHLLGTDKKAIWKIGFAKPEIVQVSVGYDWGIVPTITQEFDDHGDHYYGVWEYPFGGNIDDRGGYADFGATRQLPDVNYSNARAPFYMTSRKYGIYVESTAEGHFAFGPSGQVIFSFQEPQLTFDILYGPTYAEVLKRYNALAGPPFMPPAWAFDSIWWRDDEHDDLRGVQNAQQKVFQDVDRLQSLRIPASAIWLDRPYGSGEHGWGNMDFDSSFPDPDAMIRYLHNRGMYLLVWIANRCSNQLFEQGSAKGYLFDEPWPAADVRRSEAYAWFNGELNKYVSRGVRGYKIDRGEEGEMPRSVENENAILFPKLAAEGLNDAYHGDFLEFSRNANDTARKYTALWNGDTQSTFEGLAISIRTGLRAGAIDFPMWASDTGGYSHIPTEELFARWLEFSALSPMMEVLIGPHRTIWDDYDSQLISIAQKYTRLHHDLIPYSRSYLYQSTLTGMPLMRALVLAYPADKNVTDMWDEYLFGPDLLVAPVVQSGVTSRIVYLPAGRWLDYNDRKTIYEGGKTVKIPADLGTIPVFVRAGAIIPRGDIVKDNNNWDANWQPKLRIEIYPGRDGQRDFPYFTEKGVENIQETTAAEGIEVKLGELRVQGDIEVYCKGVREVTKAGVGLKEEIDYHYDAASNKLTIPFQQASSYFIKGGQTVFDTVTVP